MITSWKGVKSGTQIYPSGSTNDDYGEGGKECVGETYSKEAHNSFYHEEIKGLFRKWLIQRKQFKDNKNKI